VCLVFPLISVMADDWFGSQTEEVLTPFEAEHLIEELVPLKLEEIGTAKWLTQHEHLEKLNRQAHQQATDACDEFIVDHFNMTDKVSVVVFLLILIETWKEKIYPLVKHKICKMSSLRSYIPIYHEATCINLIEVLLFHRTSCETAGDALVDLVDYCYRKLTYLVNRPNSKLYTDNTDPKELLDLDEAQMLDNQYVDTEFQIAMCSISVLRFLVDHRAALPVTITSRLLETHDILLTLVPLMEKAPWVRRNRKGFVEKFEEHKWVEVTEDDMAQLPKMQIQVWLSIYGLIMAPECRARYEMTSFRKGNLLKLKRYLNDIVFDQLPPLTELLRSLEELSIQGQLTQNEAAPTPIMVELVAEVREALMAAHRDEWESIAQRQLETVFVKESPEELTRLAQMVTLPPMEDPTCGNCGAAAEMRCSQCQNEWYCSRECQVKHWKRHKPFCDVVSGNA